MEVNFTFPLEHVTALNALWKGISSVAVDKFDIVGKNKRNGWGCFPAKFQSYLYTQDSVRCFILFNLYPNSPHWEFCFYKSAASQNADWTLDFDWNFFSQIVRIVINSKPKWCCCFPSNFQSYLNTEASVPCFILFKLCSKTPHWDFCFCPSATLQNLRWTLDIVCKSCYKRYFADSLGGEKYSFHKQYHKQLMPEQLKTYPSFCGFYMIYAAFHLFRFQQEEITWVHDVVYFHF